ncbi:hypothetical protein D3C86_1891810 [compost metagenome]
MKYYSTLYINNELFVSKEYRAEKITGKIGSGDCYMAGLIYGFYHQLAPSDILGFATKAAFAKLFTSTDFSTTKIEDIQPMVQPYETNF